MIAAPQSITADHRTGHYVCGVCATECSFCVNGDLDVYAGCSCDIGEAGEAALIAAVEEARR